MDGEEGAVKMAAAAVGEEPVVVEAKAVGPDTSNPERDGRATSAKVSKQIQTRTSDHAPQT